MLGRGTATPDWDFFIAKYECTYRLDSVELALMRVPPKLQVYRGQMIQWVNFEFPCDASELHALILALRAIRNNLFHGCEFGDASWSDPVKVEFHVKTGLHCISNLIKQDPELELFFNGCNP